MEGHDSHPEQLPASSIDTMIRLTGGLEDVVRLAMKLEIEVQLEKEKNQRLHHEATHDSLTKLLNTRGLEEILANNKPPRAMLYVDGTHQKAVNDRLGHDRGDKAIIGTADVLTRSLRPNDIAARIGGDEFLVLLDMERRGTGTALSPDELLTPVISHIDLETRSFLAANADLVEVGFNIAVGGAVWREGLSVDSLRGIAENDMYLRKQSQHEMGGQNR